MNRGVDRDLRAVDPDVHGVDIDVHDVDLDARGVELGLLRYPDSWTPRCPEASGKDPYPFRAFRILSRCAFISPSAPASFGS